MNSEFLSSALGYPETAGQMMLAVKVASCIGTADVGKTCARRRLQEILEVWNGLHDMIKATLDLSKALLLR